MIIDSVHKPAFILRVDKELEKHLAGGHPWILRRDLPETSELLECPAGALVEIRTVRDRFIGIGMVNMQSPIALRILTDANVPIDVTFFTQRFEIAKHKRDAKIKAPYYRLVHAESDGLPGLIIDRFNEILVIQVSTAGMQALQPVWLKALESLFSPKTIILRNDIPARVVEGLKEYVEVIKGDVPALVEVKEYDCIFLADVLKGQKTGWFYDQRDNRHMVAKLSNGKSVLDVFSHSGGFAIPAARMGASDVMLVDASQLALDLAQQAASKNKISSRLQYKHGDAFDIMQALATQNHQFDIVVSDPPAFIPSRKDIGAGLKGYEKVAKLSAALVAQGGLLFIASCSHHASRALFRKAVLDGIKKAGRKAEIIKQTGAAIDHPVHPKLPQSEYLKGILLKII